MDSGVSLPGDPLTSVINPKGDVSNFSGTTRTNGALTMNYRMRKQSQKGTYNVQANANGVAASTSFVVQ